MIRYALCCDAGHRFDSWFYDSSAFDEQAERGLVTCPSCDSRHVVKAIMAPAVVAKHARRPSASAAPPVPVEPPVPTPSQPVELALLDHAKRQIVRAFRDKIVNETRDVGSDFAAEARRIHDDDGSDERIRGQATPQEARDLIEDGIMVVPLPTLPDDLN